MDYSHLTPAGAVHISVTTQRTVPKMRYRIRMLVALLAPFALAALGFADEILWP
jgi:hypothetical protein